MRNEEERNPQSTDKFDFTIEDGLGKSLLRFFLFQGIASASLGVCIAYAYGPASPKTYAERIDFTLRLEETTAALPQPLDDGFRVRLSLRRSLD